MKFPLPAILLAAVCSTALAEVRVPRIFGDNVILQQRAKNAVWGWADAGETVIVNASWGPTVTTKAGDDGRWKLFLDTPGHGVGHSLTIAGQNTIKIRGVAIGEVWLCAGQSNMGWSMGNSFEAEKEGDVDLPNLRIFKSAREHWHETLQENRDRLCRWKRCDPESAAETSAVSYYFGKTLHQELGVPIGIIQRAYAGTPIEGWMPWEIQQNDPRAQRHKSQLDALAARRIRNAGETVEKALGAFQEELTQYNARVDAGDVWKNNVRKIAPPIITKPQTLGHQYPGHIYNAMIHPIRNYSIRGIIWYQGERNSKNVPQAAHYRRQLAMLINNYRKSWSEHSDGSAPQDFPFQFTQLPSWSAPQENPVEGLEAPWAVNRESMRLVDRDVPGVGMVVSIDTGDAVALHPKNKKSIGIRHAYLALHQTYGKPIVGSGPGLDRHSVDGGKIVIHFDSVGTGLMKAREGELDAFAIAGVDRKWRWATAKIQGQAVVVSSSEVPSPVAVRYAWAMNPSQRNLLYNKEGFPASPFRTDDWPLYDANDTVVDVRKPNKPDGYEAKDWKRPEMAPAAAVPMQDMNGLAPEVTDLNAEDVSYALEAKLPNLKTPFMDPSPSDLGDGIAVGELGIDGGNKDAVLKFAGEIAEGRHGEVDSLLLYQNGKLLFESYYRRGRINYPHYQMSITKSYTAMAIGRAIELGHLSMTDLDKPVVSFLKDLNPDKFVAGAGAITLAEAMNMHSGIRMKEEAAKKLRRTPGLLKGQGQVQAYLENSARIPGPPREYKYQGSDPSLTMQVVEAVVPGSARNFIKTELLEKIGITSFAWQDDLSGLPKAAAGSSMRSRDMLKWGMLVMNKGKWKGKDVLPARFVELATSRLHTNKQGTSYGYFWWRHDMKAGANRYDCISGRGAGGQYILILPQLKLIGVLTAHNRGMGPTLMTFPKRILPAFIKP